MYLYETIDGLRAWMEKTFESPWTARKSKQWILKEINPEYPLEGLMLKQAPILWPPDVKSRHTGKDPDARKDRRQKKKEVAENEIVR